MQLLARLLAADAVVFLSACYVRSTFPRISSAAGRLLAALPVVLVNCALPLVFDRLTEFVTRACYLLLLVWLTNFKTLAYAVKRGPLCLPQLTLVQFSLVYALPFTPQIAVEGKIPKVKSNSRLDHSAGSTFTLAKKCALKLVLLLGIVYILSSYELPILVAEFGQAFCLYWFLGVLMDGPGAVIAWLAQLPISPHFDSPYMSRTISEFWSKRWNLTVGNVLRLLVYDPFHEGRLVNTDEPYKAARLRSFVAMCLTFVVSGLMHEIIMWYLEERAMTGQWLLFFSLQGPLLAAESLLLKAAARLGIQPPPWVGIPITLSVLLLFGHWFFFPPAINNGLDQRFFDSVKETACIIGRCSMVTILFSPQWDMIFMVGRKESTQLIRPVHESL